LKILAVSDMVIDRLYTANIAERFPGVKLILGCGDLPYEYLEFLVSAMNVPLLYVPGNHDPGYNKKIPSTYALGCDYLDQHVTRVNGLNIVGFGGSMRYRPCCENQYTQSQMYLRIISVLPNLFLKLARNSGTLDIVIAHSPPRGIHDDNDRPHTGFSAFRDLIRIFKPHYFLHGHTLAYKGNIVPPVTMVGATTVINVNPYRLIEV
jgi:Icc-related predicted phosphoesterase